MLNKKRVALVALAAIMTLGTVACGGNQQLTEQLNLGQEYMTNGDYESAIAAYEAIIATDKYAWDAHSGLVLAMYEGGKGQDAINTAINNAVAASMELAGTNLSDIEAEALQGFYATAFGVTTNDVIILNVLISANDVLKENPFEETYLNKLESMIQAYIEANNYEAAQELIDRLKEINPNANVAELEKQKEEKESADAGYIATLTKAVEYIEAGNWTALADMESSDEIAALSDRIGDVGNFSYTFTEGARTGKTIGYYSIEGCGCNEWYYGDMSNGQRSGYGGWYWAMYSDGQLYVDIYTGEWFNDAPNGSGHYSIKYGENVVLDENATYVNGLKNGTYEIESVGEDGYVWTTSYTIVNGRYVEAEVESWVGPAAEGSYTYAIAYRTDDDGTTTAKKWTVKEGAVEGIAHFRN